MKVSVPCAAALALFPLVSALPAPTPAPGEHNIIKYGLGVNGARALYPRQSGGISISIPAVEPSASRSSAASSSSSEPPVRSCACQIFVVYQRSQFSPFSSFKFDHIRTTFDFRRATLDNATAQVHPDHPYPYLTPAIRDHPHID